MTQGKRCPPLLRLGLLCALALLLAPGPGRAARSAPAVTARTTVDLVTDTDAYRPGADLHVALRVVPAPGWHVYWRDPGDAGAAPQFDLSPPGAFVGPIAWPLPDRIADGPTMSFGYTTAVLLTRTVRPGGAGPLTLATQAAWLVCEKLCVPETATLTLTLPRGAPTLSADAAAIGAALSSVPRPSPWPGFIAPNGTLWFTGVPATVRRAVFLPDQSDTTALAAPQPLRRDWAMLGLRLTPTSSFHADQPMTGVLVVGAGADRIGYEVAATPRALPAAAGFPYAALLLAVAGGLLLNLMPCVFPVLAMKALSLARLADRDRARVRAETLSHTAGVLLSFLALAGLSIALNRAGAVAGWGFQFQYPAFVVAAAWLFFAIGLNLSGVFTLVLPGLGAGQGFAARGGHAGSFATGVLAVLVATPCTAPFMGAALGAALTASPGAALAIFAALGLGFAAPYLLLAAIPSLAARLPRPGRWMEVLRQAMAFPMYAAVLWLAWVAARQSGPAGVLGLGAGLLLIAFAAWAARTSLSRRILPALSLLAGLAILPALGRGAPPAGEAFTAARLENLRAAHQPVLVNMTAAWCVTCLVNERVALIPALPLLARRHVAYLVGDWTRQDAAVTAFLHDYARDGVPLYVYFPPDQPGRVLPQVLSRAVLDALAS